MQLSLPAHDLLLYVHPLSLFCLNTNILNSQHKQNHLWNLISLIWCATLEIFKWRINKWTWLLNGKSNNGITTKAHRLEIIHNNTATLSDIKHWNSYIEQTSVSTSNVSLWVCTEAYCHHCDTRQHYHLFFRSSGEKQILQLYPGF